MRLKRNVPEFQLLALITLIIIPLAPLILIFFNNKNLNSYEFAMSIAIQWYVVARACILSHSGKFTTARLFVYAFYYVSSGLAVEMSFLLGNHSGLDFTIDLSDLGKSLFLSFISLLVLDFTLPGAEHRFSTPSSNDTPSKKIKILIFFASILLVFYIIDTGIYAIISSRESVSNNVADGALASGNIALSGIYISITKIFPLIITAIALNIREKFSRKIFWLIYSDLILILISNNPISTPRYQFAIVLVVLGFSLVKIDNSRSLNQFLALILVIVFVFPSLDFARTNEWTKKSYSLSSSFKQLAIKDFDQVLMGALTLTTVEENRDLFPVGKQILGEIGAFIPRSLWKDKPLDASIPVARHFNLPNENLSIPLWTEGFLSFRYFGVFIFPFALGFAFRRLILAKNSISIYVLQSFLLGSIFIILRGTLMQYSGLLLAAVLSTLSAGNPLKQEKK